MKRKLWVDPEALAVLAAEGTDEIVEWVRPVLAEDGGSGTERVRINVTALNQFRAAVAAAEDEKTS